MQRANKNVSHVGFSVLCCKVQALVKTNNVAVRFVVVVLVFVLFAVVCLFVFGTRLCFRPCVKGRTKKLKSKAERWAVILRCWQSFRLFC